MGIDVDPEFSKRLGGRIKIAREQKFGTAHGSSKAAARALGVTSQYLSNIESGRTTLGSDRVAELAEFFGVDAGWRLTGEETPGAAEARLTSAQRVALQAWLDHLDVEMGRIMERWRELSALGQEILTDPARAEEIRDEFFRELARRRNAPPAASAPDPLPPQRTGRKTRA